MPSERLGFVGLGVMGGAMARRLLAAGYPLAVFDVAEAAVSKLVNEGARACPDAAAVAAEADIVLLSLPTAAIVEQAILGPSGIAARATSGSVVIDLSSSTPEMTQRCGAVLADVGVALLDAPVSRGAAAARRGTLSIMVGGDAAVLARCRPVLGVLGTDVVHIGELGGGHAIKALNNHLSATILLGAIEGLVLAAKAGVDPQLALEAINAGSGASHMTEVRFPRYYLPRRFDSGFTIGLMHKDCAIARDMAAACDLPLLLGAVTTQLYQLALNQGLAAQDNTRMLGVLEDLMGARLSGSSAAGTEVAEPVQSAAAGRVPAPGPGR